MKSPFATVDRRQALYAVSAVLVAGALVLVLVPRAGEALTGIRRSSTLASPDDLPALSSDDATNFFRGRDEIEIRVPEATTLRLFLDRNRLNKPFHRRQIVEQLGNAAPDTPIAAGTTFRLRLTPTATDVPGASTSRAETR